MKYLFFVLLLTGCATSELKPYSCVIYNQAAGVPLSYFTVNSTSSDKAEILIRDIAPSEGVVCKYLESK